MRSPISKERAANTFPATLKHKVDSPKGSSSEENGLDKQNVRKRSTSNLPQLILLS